MSDFISYLKKTHKHDDDEEVKLEYNSVEKDGKTSATEDPILNGPSQNLKMIVIANPRFVKDVATPSIQSGPSQNLKLIVMAKKLAKF